MALPETFQSVWVSMALGGHMSLYQVLPKVSRPGYWREQKATVLYQPLWLGWVVLKCQEPCHWMVGHHGGKRVQGELGKGGRGRGLG